MPGLCFRSTALGVLSADLHAFGNQGYGSKWGGGGPDRFPATEWGWCRQVYSLYAVLANSWPMRCLARLTLQPGTFFTDNHIKRLAHPGGQCWVQLKKQKCYV